MAIESVGNLAAQPIEPLAGMYGSSFQPATEKPPFEKFLDAAVGSLNDLSQAEVQTNQLIEQYLAGQTDLQTVMTATAKMNLAIQMAVTVTNATATAFKEITQMQI